jgi:23S rRNA pseudouridine1911/1915/1917 synthase
MPREDRFVLDYPIGEVPHRLLGTVHGASADGKKSRSEVRVLERRDDAFLADVRIETGRPHQIRIHMAAAGYPLVGDPLYSDGGVPPEGCTALPGDPGYQLHAHLLRLRHPATGERMELRCEPPPLLRCH